MSKNLFKNQIENLKLCADKILSVNKYFQNNELTPQVQFTYLYIYIYIYNI